jgi:CHAT domain-containing protein/Tfp pilus assembly protein PilF
MLAHRIHPVEGLVAKLLILLVLAWIAGQPSVAAEEKPRVKTPASPPKLDDAAARRVEELEKQALALCAAARFADAVKPAQEILQIRTRAQGPKHWETADVRRVVATFELLAGKGEDDQRDMAGIRNLEQKAEELTQKAQYRQAQSLLEKALAIRRRVLGEEHPDTALSYNDLAQNLKAQGQYVKAQPLQEKALAIRRRTQGDEHPETAGCFNNLADILTEQGKYKEAQPLFEKALGIRRQLLGDEHPRTAVCYHNLAGNLHRQRRLAEALPLAEKALAIWRKTLGEEHPNVALGYNNVALMLSDQGRYAEAQAMVEKALAVHRKMRGEEHPLTANMYNNLAETLSEQGRYAEAEPLFEKALAIYRKTLGESHPGTAVCYSNLASNLKAQQRYAEAQPLFEKALAIWRAQLGEEHPNIASGYSNIAVNLTSQGRFAEAQPVAEKALAICRKTLGEEHPLTAKGYDTLAHILSGQYRLAEAQPLYEKSLAINRKVLGEDHPDTAHALNRIANNLYIMGRYAEAEPYFVAWARAFEVNRLRAGGSGLDRASYAAEQSRLPLFAGSLAHQGKFAEAWNALEANLARGLLDEFSTRLTSPFTPEERKQQQELGGHLQQVDQQVRALLGSGKPLDAISDRLQELTQQAATLQADLGRLAARISVREVYDLARVQNALAPDTALLAWVDLPYHGKEGAAKSECWACLLRHRGAPRFLLLLGTGPRGTRTQEDEGLPQQARNLLVQGSASWGDKEQALLRRLYDERLKPLEGLLQRTDQFPAVRHLVILPVGRMGVIPVEALTDRYTISYAPSATIFARIREQRPQSQNQRREQSPPRLLALANPALKPPEAVRQSAPVPEKGVLVTQVVAGANAATHGIKSGDVLLEYGGTRLASQADLRRALQATPQKPSSEGTRGGPAIPVKVWREGQTLDVAVQTGALGVFSDPHPAPEAVRLRHEADDLLRRTRGPLLEPLPFARYEVKAIAALFPQSNVLLGSQARAERLEEMAARDQLRSYRYLHFATHGLFNNRIALQSALVMAQDGLPDAAGQVLAGHKTLDGQVTAAWIRTDWKLDADLVVLSACHSGLGPQQGGEGFVGFSQALLLAGARSLVLSQWQVDDKATALLMKRFYENLLGARADQRKPLPKAEALKEAKAWLRGLTTDQAEAALRTLASGDQLAQGSKERGQPVAKKGTPVAGHPYAHPYYWAAFVLVGDPE